MLSWKNDPQNFRAMRLLVKEPEVLRSVIMTELDTHASCSRTMKDSGETKSGQTRNNYDGFLS